MERQGPRPLTSWAARQGIYHIHLFRWDLLYQVAQMLSFEPYLKDNCLQQHWALHRLRMSVAMPGRGWAAKLIPGANLDFRSFAIFLCLRQISQQCSLFCLLAVLCPSLQGRPAPYRARQSLQVKDLGVLCYLARPAIHLRGLWQLT